MYSFQLMRCKIPHHESPTEGSVGEKIRIVSVRNPCGYSSNLNQRPEHKKGLVRAERHNKLYLWFSTECFIPKRDGFHYTPSL